MSAINPWTEPHFKEKRARKVVNGLAARETKAKEDANKTKVRRRDKYCRFPLCGCYKFKLPLHVSHSQHKGMGGNPKGDRSDPALMILLCSARHRENRISFDQGTLRWKAIGHDTHGHPLVAWEVDERAVKYGPATIAAYRVKWVEVARETALHVYQDFTPAQRELLAKLADMTL